MLSIVIPTYNEEKNVKLLYTQLKPVLENLRKKYEIITDPGIPMRATNSLPIVTNNSEATTTIPNIQ